MEQSSEEVHQNMIRKRKIFFIMPVIRHYIAILVTFFFYLVYHRTGSLRVIILDTKIDLELEVC